MWKEMKSFRFVLRNKLNGKTFSYTDHLNVADKTKEWYITDTFQESKLGKCLSGSNKYM